MAEAPLPVRGTSGGGGDIDPVTLTGVITWDVQPQVEGGNEALTKALTDTIAQYDPALATSVVEGLKSPATTPLATTALLASTTPAQQGAILGSMAPFSTSPDYYAYRGAQEHDVSLISREAIAGVAQRQADTRAAAAMLMQQGELATADSMKYLADHGFAKTSDAFKASEQMRESMRQIEDSHMLTARRGDQFVAIMQVPGAPIPMMNAAGPVENGVWRPMVNGFAISTPARQQMMEQFNRPEMREHLQREGIQQILPVFRSSAEPNMAMRPPTQQQTRDQTPRWEDVERSPQYQQSPPAVQQMIKQRYFDRHMALTPVVKNAVRQNPQMYQAISDRFVGPQQIVGPPEAPPPEGITGLVKQHLTKSAQDIFGPIGSAVAGATEGFVPPSVTEGLRSISGEHPVYETLGGYASDIAATPFGGPVLGPAALESARAGARAAWKGLPVISSAADLAKGSVPVFGQPKDITAAAAQAALGQALLWKAAPYVLKPVGKVLGKAGEVVKNVIKRGAWTGKDLKVLQEIAYNDKSSFGLWVNNRILNQMPEIRVTTGKKLRILMKDGSVLDETNFNPQAKSILERMRADPNYRPDFIDIPEMQNVELIEGPASKINTLFDAQDMALRVDRADLAKGANVRQVKGQYEVRQGSQIDTFPDQAAAQAFVDKLPVAPTMVEQQGLKRLASQGVNGHYLVANVKNPVSMVGELAATPSMWESIGQFVQSWKYKPVMATFMKTEARGGAPLFSQVYDKVEAAVVKQKQYEVPWRSEINTLLKGIKKGDKRLEGYTLLMDNFPGSTEWDKIVKQYKLDDQIGRGIQDWILRFSADMGLSGPNILFNVIPNLRRFGSVAAAYPAKNIPKEVEYFMEAQLTGKLNWADREGNIRNMMNAMLTEGAFNKHVKTAYENATTVLEAIKGRPTEQIVLENYLRALRGWGQGADGLVYRGIGGLIQRVTQGKLDPVTQGRVGKEFIGSLFAWNYGAYFGFRPAAILRQGFQIVQTIYPRLGEIGTAQGILRASGKGSWDRVRQAGAMAGNPYREEGFVGWSTRGVGWADDYMRAIAFHGTEALMEKPLSRYLVNKNWQSFARDSRLNLMSEEQQRVVKDLIDAGHADEAILRAGRFVSDEVNFNYSPTNRPPILNYVSGSFLGQFGSYPAWYTNYIGLMMTRGSSADKVLGLARFVAAHGAVYETCKTLFNADMTNFLFLGPLNYTGGAVASKAWHAEQALVGSGRQREEARKDVLNPTHWVMAFVPGSSAAADWMDAVHTRTGADFFREFFLAAPAYDKNK